MADHAHQPTPPIGAVMVVGGGIAGMQASLDLAESGFKVYLVESKSAIGGHMAQLDKTFPTNDCAMCNISPKLVDVGRHINIEILPDTEVVKVDGEAGNFTATVRHKPRYIDVAKCTGCGECAQVCPVVIPGRFDEGMVQQRAAYKLYPQAIPNAYAIEKKGLAPCRDACPTGQRAQGYIALIREGRYHDALRVIKEDNPFPGICGRICNHRCETACNRGRLDEPVNIRALKRFVTDKVYADPRQPVERIEPRTDKRVAVIGAGPCGLTAAKDLVRLGYPVTVFEALPVAGGMLRVGVPEYRLPTWIIEREVADIVDLGVDLRLNSPVTNLDDLFTQGFDTVLIAVGAHEGIRLPIPGADLDGVHINTVFLRDVRLGQPPALGERVIVIGAGDVAMDCARTAVRLGKQVHIHYRRSRAEAPADPEEIEHATEEGVEFHWLSNPVEILSDGNSRVGGMRCVRMELSEPDESGRRRPVPVPGSEHVVPCDSVIFSVGQRAGLAFIPKDAGVGTTRDNTIAIHPETLAATRPGVFAAGDSVSGTAFVIEAVASGHQAALSIDQYLRGKQLESGQVTTTATTIGTRFNRVAPLPVVRMTEAELRERATRGEVKITPRVKMSALDATTRKRSFDEVRQGYTDAEAQAEAARCLACGVCSECLSCYYKCGVAAINHDLLERIEQIKVGAVILAPGYEVYNAALSQEYGLGRYPNVVTALQFERLLSASGPTQGHVNRPSDGKPPKKIAFLQCVGSRDQTHDYCSSVCCMYAAKESIMALEHAKTEGHELECHVFFMDTRAFSKGYEEYYQRAENKYGVQYHRTRISAIKQNPTNGNLVLRCPAVSNTQYPILISEEEFDLVVLSVGMEISDKVKALGRDLGIELDDYGFCHTTLFDPLQSSRAGIYVAGPFREPKDIPETVVEASGAAGAAEALLATARGTLARKAEYPPERDMATEEPRVGVFVCHCGSNIGGFLDVPATASFAAALPGVVHAEDNLYTCSQDTIQHIVETAKEKNLNRVVVASCTPRTHEPLFQDACRMAGLNPGLFEMANIRNQCSWVHSDDWAGATRKAEDLVRGAVMRAAQLEPVRTVELPVQKAALVIGGGAAGMNAALTLAEQGFPVHLVERTAQLGGGLCKMPSVEDATSDPQAYLQRLVEQVKVHPLVRTHLETELIETGGFQGNFESKLRTKGGIITEITHGAVIVATGSQEYRGPEYGLGSDPRVVTQVDFESLLAEADKHGDKATRRQGDRLPSSVVMIQCIGPAEKYCSRTCCATALVNALKLKELNPDAQVTILYKDMRTFGFKERLYTEARRAGILFIRYDDTHRPQISTTHYPMSIQVWEPMMGRELTLTPDRVVLSEPMVPADGTKELGSLLKVPTDLDGWFLEAHIKLRPVDFASDGIFMAGDCHYPKFLDEAIAQAQAAASRAATILSRDTLTAGGSVAQVNAEQCVGCLTCVRICPYHVPKIQMNLSGVGNIIGAAYIEPATCHGCGICAGECPAKAIRLVNYSDAQVMAKVESLFASAANIPLSVT
jgi:heterodisulfide reductase subunit A-like polyferredoxin